MPHYEDIAVKQLDEGIPSSLVVDELLGNYVCLVILVGDSKAEYLMLPSDELVRLQVQAYHPTCVGLG